MLIFQDLLELFLYETFPELTAFREPEGEVNPEATLSTNEHSVEDVLENSPMLSRHHMMPPSIA